MCRTSGPSLYLVRRTIENVPQEGEEGDGGAERQGGSALFVHLCVFVGLRLAVDRSKRRRVAQEQAKPADGRVAI